MEKVQVIPTLLGHDFLKIPLPRCCLDFPVILAVVEVVVAVARVLVGRPSVVLLDGRAGNEKSAARGR